jgi:hypothetical protein
MKLCYESCVHPMRTLLLACLTGTALTAGALCGVFGQDTGRELETVSTTMNDTSPNEQATSPRAGSAGSRFGWLWFPGAIAFYFALQLWILPKMGVPT